LSTEQQQQQQQQMIVLCFVHFRAPFGPILHKHLNNYLKAVWFYIAQQNKPKFSSRIAENSIEINFSLQNVLLLWSVNSSMLNIYIFWKIVLILYFG